MIYKTPKREIVREQGRSFALECVNLVDSLPDEFEIVEPGMTQVRWPESYTRQRLENVAQEALDFPQYNRIATAKVIQTLAAIAPEEKKKRTISVWESGGHLIAVRDNPNLDSQVVVGWRKVGECEVSE